MKTDDKILVAGATGLVGSALHRALVQAGYSNVVAPQGRKELDFTDQAKVNGFFWGQRFTHVFVCAARVGGIHANNTEPVSFLMDNLRIQSNLFEAAHAFHVPNLMFFGSSCIYPKFAPQPMRPEHLGTSALEETNRAYATAKLAGVEACRAYQIQHRRRYFAVLPSNVYGDRDYYDYDKAHVIPAMIRKFVEARNRCLTDVELWGDGFPRREFIHAKDLARAAIFLMRDYHGTGPVNIGGDEVPIHVLAKLIRRLVGFKGGIIWNTDKPSGTPQKSLDNSVLETLGFERCISLADGLRSTIFDFEACAKGGTLRV